MKDSKSDSCPACAVLLAGGRGTRFWPRSRTRLPKQLLEVRRAGDHAASDGRTRRPLFAAKNFCVVTNAEQAARVRRELPFLSAGQIFSEPIGRNTAAAVHLAHAHGDALMAVLRRTITSSKPRDTGGLPRGARARAASRQPRWFMGVPPAHPETGFSYIERAGSAGRLRRLPRLRGAAFCGKAFTRRRAWLCRRSRRYFWNAGMFFWRVSTFLDDLKKFLAATHAALMALGTNTERGGHAPTLARTYRRGSRITSPMTPSWSRRRAARATASSVLPGGSGLERHGWA